MKKKKADQLKLGIAGITFSLISDDDSEGFYIEDFYKNFITEDKPELTLRVHHGNIPRFNNGKRIFDSGTTWRLLHKNGKHIFETSSRTAIFDSDFKAGEIYVQDEKREGKLPFPLNYPLGEVLTINLLSKNRGVMLHACGVDENREGYLFLGNSAHGKSTIARLWFNNRATVLNDDRVIARERNGEFWMYGTPWSGEFKKVSPQGLLIKKIFFLRQGKKNAVVRKKGIEAVSMLLTRCFPPFWDKNGMDYTIGLSHRLASKIPCYELSFIPDDRIIDFVRKI